MYYPYLRGRQNELLCIRELLETGNLSNQIIPVIEPVRFNSTFFSTVAKFIEKERSIIIIRNPKVGHYMEERSEAKNKIEKETDEEKRNKLRHTMKTYQELLDNKYIINAYITDDRIVEKVLSGEKDIKNIVLLNLQAGDCEYYEEYGEKLEAKLTFIPRDEDFKDEVTGSTIMLEDCFVKAKRNLDYIDTPDTFFSRNHIVYKKRGYEGFSDYSIVGKEFEESGFAPIAIAIHMTYFGEKNKVYIHHFVSDSNESYNDPARKFEEAMDKLIDWEYYDELPKTKGLLNLLECYEHGKFPGLGIIKRYSLMHHIQMIGDYLEGK